ncbi:MAG: prohibitin family protein, partial [Gammaproteobacteria bacterium]|nr:prohibitin family protein [Gammaproteobacteria bacterium]
MAKLNIVPRHKSKIILFVLIFLFFLAYFFKSIFIYVYPGQSGVLFRSLSSQPMDSKVYTEGLYTIAPWNMMYIYDLTKQRMIFDIDALTSNGLTVKLSITAIFQLDRSKLDILTMNYGIDYRNKIITPAIFSSTREIIGHYLPESLYTTAMHVIQQQIHDETIKDFQEVPFNIEHIVVEKLELPDSINQAIESKLKHQQKAQAYEYILVQEKDEAKRREIEAESI